MDDLTNDYPQRAETAHDWVKVAGLALRSGAWLSDSTEERVAGNLVPAIRPVLTPSTQYSPTWHRISQLGRHASVLRLAAQCLGAVLPWCTVAARPPTAEMMSLQGLVTGLHGEAVWWELLYQRCVHSYREQQMDELLAGVPYLDAHLVSAERLWFDIGGVAELFVMIATGDAD